ncbi:MAG TPA: type II secretion system protein N [Pseudomonas sp.]|nr:type II secretion system protein N [Pseudomonas sp.]
MPLSAPQRWLQQQAPTLLGIALILAISVSLAWQTADWLRLLRTPVASSSPTPSAPAAPSADPQISQLFGSSAAPSTAAAPATHLRLTLLGSFVHADPKRSSAIIRSEGSAAQRFTVDSEVASGVRLHAVAEGHVELMRNGHRESLSFPLSQTQDGVSSYGSASPEDALEQLSELEDDNLVQLRERMDALRQQMEASGTVPADAEPTEQPTEND